MAPCKYFQYGITDSIDVQAVSERLNGVNINALTDVVKARIDRIGADPLINVVEGDRPKTVDHQEAVLRLLRALAATITVEHLVELTRLEQGKTHRCPVTGFDVLPDSGPIVAKVRSNGVHRVKIPLFSRLSLSGLLHRGISSGGPFRDSTGDLTYSRMILEMLALNDLSLESIDSYAKTQHDWCVSSIMASVSSPSGISTAPIYLKRFVMAMASSLLYGCRSGAEDAVESMTLMEEPKPRHSDRMSSGLALVQWFIQSIACRSCSMQDGGRLYDAKRLESVVSRNCDPSHPDIRWMYSYKSLMEAERHGGNVTRPPFYRSCFNLIDLPSPHTMGSLDLPCQSADLPDALRGKITREMLVGLERKTHFISNVLAGDVLGWSFMDDLDSALADGGRIDPDTLHVLIAGEDMDMHVQYDGSQLFTKDSRVMGGRIDREILRVNRALKYVTTSLLDDERRSCCSSKGGFTDDTARYLAFMKLYTVHRILRLPESLPKANEDILVTPLEKFVMDDVIRSVWQVRKEGLLRIDDGSPWYEELTGRCMDVCVDDNLAGKLADLWDYGKGLDGNLKPEGVTWEHFLCSRAEEALASDVVDLYRRMDHGDLQDLEHVFQRVDGTMVDAIIDYHVDRRMGCDLPGEFLMEDLRMDVVSGYEDQAVRVLADGSPCMAG